MQENVEAFPGETVTLITEFDEPDLEVTWLKDNVALSVADERYLIVNEDCSYELMIPDVTVQDAGLYTVQGGSEEATFQLTVIGKQHNMCPFNGVNVCKLELLKDYAIPKDICCPCRAKNRISGEYRSFHWRNSDPFH